ncbi:hypothetical protein DIZ76_012794 [Coccidioides immitis]|nr:hypothetical protein DIZ76_012794 [Coccidioides immitis]
METPTPTAPVAPVVRKSLQNSTNSTSKDKNGDQPEQTQKKAPRKNSQDAQSADNITLPVPSQCHWSLHNLPDILYQLNPTDGAARKSDPVQLKPSPYYGQAPIRVFDILPDRISSNVEDWRVEAWLRLDRRIRLKDITARMAPDFAMTTNALQQRNVRFRQLFNIVSWGKGNKLTENHREKIHKMLEERGIDLSLNTTRGITPGLIDPNDPGKGRIPFDKNYLKNIKDQEERARKRAADNAKKSAASFEVKTTPTSSPITSRVDYTAGQNGYAANSPSGYPEFSAAAQENKGHNEQCDEDTEGSNNAYADDINEDGGNEYKGDEANRADRDRRYGANSEGSDGGDASQYNENEGGDEDGDSHDDNPKTNGDEPEESSGDESDSSDDSDYAPDDDDSSNKAKAGNNHHVAGKHLLSTGGKRLPGQTDNKQIVIKRKARDEHYTGAGPSNSAKPARKKQKLTLLEEQQQAAHQIVSCPQCDRQLKLKDVEFHIQRCRGSFQGPKKLQPPRSLPTPLPAPRKQPTNSQMPGHAQLPQVRPIHFPAPSRVRHLQSQPAAETPRAQMFARRGFKILKPHGQSIQSAQPKRKREEPHEPDAERCKRQRQNVQNPEKPPSPKKPANEIPNRPEPQNLTRAGDLTEAEETEETVWGTFVWKHTGINTLNPPTEMPPLVPDEPYISASPYANYVLEERMRCLLPVAGALERVLGTAIQINWSEWLNLRTTYDPRRQENILHEDQEMLKAILTEKEYLTLMSLFGKSKDIPWPDEVGKPKDASWLHKELEDSLGQDEFGKSEEGPWPDES